MPVLKIHRNLGPGLLESVYEQILQYELKCRQIKSVRQVPIPVFYDSIKLEVGFKADLIVEKTVLIELKSVEVILPVHKKQLLTYLKLTNLKLGLLINFNENLMKHGLTRIVMVYDVASLRLCERITLNHL